MKRAPRYKRPFIIPWPCIWFHFRLLGTVKKVRYVWLIAITAVSGAAAIRDPIDLMWWFTGAAFCWTAYDIYSQYLSNKQLSVKPSATLPRLMEVIRPSVGEDQAGYTVIRVPGRADAILVSERVNDYLRLHVNDISLVWEPDRRDEIVANLRSQADFFKDVLIWRYNKARSVGLEGAVFRNDLKIGLADTIVPGMRAVKVFKTSYYLSFLTNDLCALDVEDISNMASPESRWSSAEHFPQDYGGTFAPPRIRSLEASMLSNHIGGNTIAITKDRRLVVRRQARAIRSSGFLAPTGSGSLDYSDSQDEANISLGKLVSEGIVRELLEENHAEGSRIKNWAAETRIIGYFRWLGLGGLPGFLGISRLSVDSHHLRPNTAEVDSPGSLPSYPAENINELMESVRQLLESPALSVPLFANLYVLKNLLAAEPNSVDFLFSE